MKKPMLFAALAAAAIWSSTAAIAQYSGQAVGQNPAGNSTLGGGNSSSGNFGTYAAALRLLHAQKYDESIPYLEAALADRPRNTDTLTYLGYAHFKIGDRSGALGFYQKAISINPDNKRTHQYLGELYLEGSDATSADAQLAELTRLCPDGCDEKDALTKEIGDYHASAHASATPVAPAH